MTLREAVLADMHANDGVTVDGNLGWDIAAWGVQ